MDIVQSSYGTLPSNEKWEEKKKTTYAQTWMNLTNIRWTGKTLITIRHTCLDVKVT